MQAFQLNVDDEVIAIGNAIVGLVNDIKAGKAALVDAEDAFAALVGAVGSLQNLPADIKKIDNQVYLAKVLAGILEPVVAAPAAAV